MNIRLNLVLGLLLAAGPYALGQTACKTPDGANVPDGFVNAEATFTVTEGTLQVTLVNNLADPRSAGQLLSGLAFTLSNGQVTGSLALSSGNERKIAKGGSFLDLGSGDSGWALDTDFGGGLRLCVLCTGLGAVGPKHLIVGQPNGSGRYGSANGSIAGNKPHNPFLFNAVTFTISAPGVSLDTIVTSVTFFFSTQEGVAVTGTCAGEPQPG